MQKQQITTQRRGELLTVMKPNDDSTDTVKMWQYSQSSLSYTAVESTFWLIITGNFIIALLVVVS
jgi:hypothetical protein